MKQYLALVQVRNDTNLDDPTKISFARHFCLELRLYGGTLELDRILFPLPGMTLRPLSYKNLFPLTVYRGLGTSYEDLYREHLFGLLVRVPKHYFDYPRYK